MPTIPPYPSFASWPRQFNQQGQLIAISTQNADIKNLDALGAKIWAEAHAVDPTLGGAAYGSDAWRYQFEQNGRAASVGVPLPFPQMIGWDAYFPAYTATSTKQDAAPGETPFNQCDNYKKDGALALADFSLRYPNLRDTDLVPGTVITKAQAVTNIKVDYNQEAKAHGCTSIPFPEADGKTRVAAEPPPAPPPTPKPNTLNGTPVDENGTPATGGPYPGDVNTPVPQGQSSPTGGGPTVIATNPNGPIPNPGMPPRPLPEPPGVIATEGPTGQLNPYTPTAPGQSFPWLWLAIGVAVVYFLTRGDT